MANINLGWTSGIPVAESANNDGTSRGLGPAPPGRTSKEVPAIVKITLSYILICGMQFTGALLTVVFSLVVISFGY
ncbi:uncharacterized protein N7518_002476 [Penicillium psychrosexuale]|uniref:uncharacterized protein n=1 Tax=Penicillium psychrosexuale TaxID=1002107 RepID=UPI0025450515|nr:uncharacterized protein N7518_002476 [Penicillium psychrosexuale]KAJ5800408.1 hypothetical protein N7518_002476 [Penicillium psychrosexuale]